MTPSKVLPLILTGLVLVFLAMPVGGCADHRSLASDLAKVEKLKAKPLFEGGERWSGGSSE